MAETWEQILKACAGEVSGMYPEDKIISCSYEGTYNLSSFMSRFITILIVF